MRPIPLRALLPLLPAFLLLLALCPGAPRPALAAPTTVTFSYTGAAQSWTVPAGVTQATFDLDGAAGGSGNNGRNAGGLGGRATATIVVTPGTIYQINVG